MWRGFRLDYLIYVREKLVPVHIHSPWYIWYRMAEWGDYGFIESNADTTNKKS